MTVTIWHNPRFTKSRQTLALLQEKGVAPTVREYLKQPPAKAEVEALLDMVGGEPGALIRDGEAEFKALGIKKAEMSRAEIAESVPSTQAVFRPRRRLADGVEAVTVDRGDWAVLAVLDGRRSVAQTIAATGRGSFEVCSALHRLHQAGVIEQVAGS